MKPATTEPGAEYITVLFRGSAMMLLPHIAERLGLKPYHVIQTETEFWPILRANTIEMIRLCELEIGKEPS